jgi:iron uptake system component EfeO
MTCTRSFRWLISTACVALIACSNASEPESDYEASATLDVKHYVAGELQNLTTAAEALQKAAPDADDNGWNANDDKAALEKMRAAWGDARDAYERIEGSIAVLFHTLDISTDERYDGFIESDPDDNLFDDEGVTGVHAIERILWSDKIPERVVKFESAIPGYKKAAFPATKEEADAFKNKLCARLVSDVKQMRTEFTPLTLDSASAFRGMIGSMQEQSEKTTKAATGQDESRYAQRTLADMRANLDGAKAVFSAFKAWIDASDGKSQEIQSGLDAVSKAYSEVDGPALPEVPANFKPSDPSDDQLATPYGKLWQLLNTQTDPENEQSLVSVMAGVADDMKIPLIPE